MMFNILHKILLPLDTTEDHPYHLEFKNLQSGGDCIEVLVVDCFKRGKSGKSRFFLITKLNCGTVFNMLLLDMLKDFCSKDGYSSKAVGTLRYCDVYIPDIPWTTDYVPLCYCEELFVQESETYYRWVINGKN